MREAFTGVRMMHTKIEGAQEYRFNCQVLYAPFERQIKCISNSESALCIEFRITVTFTLEYDDRNSSAREGKQEQEKIDEEYLVS